MFSMALIIKLHCKLEKEAIMIMMMMVMVRIRNARKGNTYTHTHARAMYAMVAQIAAGYAIMPYIISRTILQILYTSIYTYKVVNWRVP